jgi:hypothetical protein
MAKRYYVEGKGSTWRAEVRSGGNEPQELGTASTKEAALAIAREAAGPKRAIHVMDLSPATPKAPRKRSTAKRTAARRTAATTNA